MTTLTAVYPDNDRGIKGQCCPGCLVSRAAVHGLGLAGYHRFVNIAFTGHDDPVIWDGISAFDDEQVAGSD